MAARRRRRRSCGEITGCGKGALRSAATKVASGTVCCSCSAFYWNLQAKDPSRVNRVCLGTRAAAAGGAGGSPPLCGGVRGGCRPPDKAPKSPQTKDVEPRAALRLFSTGMWAAEHVLKRLSREWGRPAACRADIASAAASAAASAMQCCSQHTSLLPLRPAAFSAVDKGMLFTQVDSQAHSSGDQI